MTNPKKHHTDHRHHHHLDDSEIFKRKTLSAAQRRKKFAKILYRFLCILAVAVTIFAIYLYTC